MRTCCQWGGVLCLPTSPAAGALLSSPPAWPAPALAGDHATPCRGVLPRLPAAADSVVPRVASLLQQEEQGMPVACSIPTPPGPGRDQPELLEAVSCSIWLASPLGLSQPPGPAAWGCLALLGLLPSRERTPGQGSFGGASSCLGIPTLEHQRGAEPQAGCCRHRAGGRQAAGQILLARVRVQRVARPVRRCCCGRQGRRVAQGARNRAAGGD